MPPVVYDGSEELDVCVPPVKSEVVTKSAENRAAKPCADKAATSDKLDVATNFKGTKRVGNPDTPEKTSKKRKRLTVKYTGLINFIKAHSLNEFRDR